MCARVLKQIACSVCTRVSYNVLSRLMLLLLQLIMIKIL